MWEKVINALLGQVPPLSCSVTWPNAKDSAGKSKMGEVGSRGEQWNHKKKESRISKSLFEGEPPGRDGKSRTLPLDYCMNKTFLLQSHY